MGIQLERTVLPSGQTPNVSAQLSLGSGIADASAEFGNVIGQLGGRATDLSLRMQSLQAVEEITDGDLALSAGYDTFRTDLQQGQLQEDGSRASVDTDYAGHVAKYDAWMKESSESILGGFKNNRARESASTSFKKQGQRWRREIELGAFDSLRRQSQAKISPKINAYNERILATAGANERADVIDEREVYLLNLEATGIITDAQFRTWNKLAGERLNELVEERVADAALVAAGSLKDENGDIDFNAGREVINASELSEDRKIKLIKDLEAQSKWDKEQNDLARQRKHAKGESDLWEIWIDPSQPLLVSRIEEDFDAGNITKEVRDKYVGRIGKSPIDTTRGLKWEVNEMVLRAEAGEISPDEVTEFIGQKKIFNAIGDDDLTSFQNRLGIAKRKLSEGTATQVTTRNGQNTISNLRAAELSLLGPAADRDILEVAEIEFKYLRIMDDFNEWIELNPKATDDQIESRIKGLLIPEADEVTLNWFERRMAPRQPNRVLISEPEILVRKKIEAISKQDFFENLSDQEKADIQRRFEDGETVGQVVDDLLDIDRGDEIRNDGSLKGPGFLGELQLPDGRVSTEFSIGVEFDGKKTEIPTLVPTLTQDEIDLMVNDIIPNDKKIPDKITKKAIAHAKKRIAQGKSPFKDGTDPDTVIMVSPDGRRFAVPVGKKQEMLDNGLREE